jgi:CheY-like chemotaxis protein
MSLSKRVLVVGVLDGFQAVLARWSSEWGHDARFAPDPAAAHSAIADWLPDLVLVDHLRTPPDFQAWWTELRSHAALAAVPTIVTGNVGQGPIQQQAAAILRRPYTRSELESVIARVLGAAGRDPST